MAPHRVESPTLSTKESIAAPLLLHAWWSDVAPIGLVLAGEDGNVLSSPRRSDGSHPYASDPSRWAHLLGIATVQKLRVAALVTLPTQGGTIVPSPQLTGEDALVRRTAHGELSRAQFYFPALHFSPAQTFDLFNKVAFSEIDELVLSDAGKLFLQIFYCVLQSMEERRFLPSLDRGSQPLNARWISGDETTTKRVDAIAQGAPRVLGSLISIGQENAAPLRNRRAATTPRHIRAICLDAHSRLLDAGIRYALKDEEKAFGSESSDLALFVHALEKKDCAVTLPTKRVRALDEYIQRCIPEEGSSRWVLCLRIESPSNPNSWPVVFSLVAIDRPAVMVDAELIFKSGRVLQIAGETIEEPVELFLSEMRRVGAISDLVKDALSQENPTQMVLTLSQLGQLLVSEGQALSRGGVRILRPSELDVSSSRLSLSAKLQDPFARGKSLHGAGSMVAVNWGLLLGELELSEEEIEGLAKSVQGIVSLRGRFVELHPEEIHEMLLALRSAPQSLSVIEALRLASGVGITTAKHSVVVNGQDAIRAYLSSHSEVEESEAPSSLPSSLFVGSLRPHQQSARRWLARLEDLGLGAILADDMGLGKTASVLSHLASTHAGTNSAGPTLVVVPTSLLRNWVSESGRFVPSLSLYLHHGESRLHGDALISRCADVDIVITSYPLVVRDLATLQNCAFSRLVLDEAHILKSPLSQTRQSVAQLKVNRRIALSGTPIQNHLGELWSLMDLVNPGLLGDAHWFRTHFGRPIEEERNGEVVERLLSIISPFVLRRVKSDPQIAPELPTKTHSVVECALSLEQVTLYRAVVDQLRTEMREVEGKEAMALGLRAMTHLIEICDHPAVFLDEKAPILGRSGKIDRLVSFVEEVVASGQRVLIFTRFVKMGSLVQRAIESQLRQPVLFFHGGLSLGARDQLVTLFQDPNGTSSVMVVSLHAGGTGLNLTAASVVIHLDRWWNPAVFDQATDRAHRIGQRNDVSVYTFLCPGTLEERISQILDSKKELASLVVGDGDEAVATLSPEELLHALTLSGELVEEPL